MVIQDLKVLICDDSMFARKKMSMTISALGISEIFEAADGEEAVAKYKEKRPDVVFMDIIMPKITGDRKSTRLNSSHSGESRMPSSA